MFLDWVFKKYFQPPFKTASINAQIVMQRNKNLLYIISMWNIYHHNYIPYIFLTLLLRQTTGHSEQPSVQQQQMHPQNSHFTFIGSVFFRIPLIRVTVALNSSGATRDTRPEGNSTLKRLLRPNLQNKKL